MSKNKIMDNLAIYITEQCKLKNLSVKDYAKKCQLSEDYIRKLKSSKFKAPGLDTLELLANGLDITLKELLEGINAIDIITDYMISEKDAASLLQAILPYLSKCGIDVEPLNSKEKFELVNYLILTLKMIMNKY